MRATARPGFGLLSSLVVVAAVLILAAVVASNLRGYEHEAAIRETAADLQLFDAALTNAWQASTRYPQRLSGLGSPPTTSDKNSCGDAWTSGNETNWQTKFPFGPYYKKRLIPLGTGFVLGIGVAMDTLVRVPAGSGATGAGTLTIRIPDVSEYEAYQLDTIIDVSAPNLGRTTGKIQWTLENGGRVDTLKFVHTRVNSSC